MPRKLREHNCRKCLKSFESRFKNPLYCSNECRSSKKSKKIASNKASKTALSKHEFDLTETPEFMYFLGFLWADGYFLKINSKGHSLNRVSLEILKDDYECIYIPPEFNRYDRIRKNRQPQSKAEIHNVKLFQYLMNHGYEDRKSPSDYILSHEFSNYWFLGLIDGDGCWYFNQKNKCRQFSLAGHYDQDWTYFTKLLDTLECSYNIKRRIQGKNKHSIVRMCNKDSIKKLGKYIYLDHNIGLTRKKKKWIQCITTP